MILYLLTLLLGLNPPKTQPQPAQNGVLVVFKRVGTAYRYQGTLDKFTLPPTVANKGLLSFPKPPNKPSTQTNLDRQGYPYLFYVVKNENTASFYYSPDSKRFQDEEGVVVNLPPKEDALLKSFLSNAKPAPIQHRPVHVDASYPGTIDFHLKFLCKAADYIAVGRVVGVLREGHTPLNNTNDSSRHTVFLVAVEQYLKSATPQAPAILKIWQVGGWYSHASGDPLLGVGERYLLFLRLLYLQLSRKDRTLGYIGGSISGVEGPLAFFDEMIFVHPLNSQILLRDGMTLAPNTQDITPHWRFRQGPQIIDVTEQQAIQNILDAPNLPLER